MYRKQHGGGMMYHYITDPGGPPNKLKEDADRLEAYHYITDPGGPPNR